MNDPMKPPFNGERAKRFLRDTVVGCSEGALFVAISVLFGAAGLAAIFETNRLAEDAAWVVSLR